MPSRQPYANRTIRHTTFITASAFNRIEIALDDAGAALASLGSSLGKGITVIDRFAA
jgi:hypothetical protein